MKSQEIYNRAKYFGVELQATCEGISISEWEKLMQNATKANTRQVEQIVKKWAIENENHNLLAILNCPYQPYTHYKTDTHIIYVHSAIEHFFSIN